MNKIKNWLNRILLAFLFWTALVVTFQGISGVEATSLTSYLRFNDFHRKEVEGSHSTHNFRLMEVAAKFIEKVTDMDLKISPSKQVSGAPQTLEEAIDWSQYPSTEVIATGYTAGYESTGKSPGHPQFGITYSGVKVTRDLYSTVAADLDVFPIGTILFIPGYGYGVVADKGSAIKGNKVDLYYETVEDVYKSWGKKTVEVFVIERGDGTLTEGDLKALNEDESMQVFRQQYIQVERE